MDAAGNAHVTGWTYSTNFPTLNPIQAQKSGDPKGAPPNSDVFVTTLNPTGSGLLFSTYLGGTSSVNWYNGYGNGIALDAAGNTYLTGLASSTNFPTTAGVLSRTNGNFGTYGGANAFVAKTGRVPSATAANA